MFDINNFRAFYLFDICSPSGKLFQFRTSLGIISLKLIGICLTFYCESEESKTRDFRSFT